MELGCAAGRSPLELEDWTWGETLMLVRSRQKAERQRYQALSVIGWESAVLTAKCPWLEPKSNRVSAPLVR